MAEYSAERQSLLRRWLNQGWWFFFGPAPPTPTYDHPLSAADRVPLNGFPINAMLGAFCLLIAALGITGARYNTPYHELFFWAGLLAMFSIAAYRMVLPQTNRRERIGLLVMVGMGLYLVKVMHSPLYYTFYDELLHLRTANDILLTGRLFSEHSLLPVSPFYPGLEIVTTALVNLTGLDVFTSGILVVGVARLSLMLMLYMFFEQVTNSIRISSIATLIYASNPHFIFFDAQFSYESLALLFIVTALYGIEYRFNEKKGGQPLGATLLILMMIAATLITHHVTSYFLIAVVILWAVVVYVQYWGNPYIQHVLFWTVLFAFVVTFSWMMYLANITIDYLVPTLSGAVFDLIRVVLREEAGRQLFSGQGDYGVRAYEQVIVYIATLIILIGLAWGTLALWHYHRRHHNYVALAVIGLLYPVTQVLRFTERGPEIASRIGPFMYVGIGFTIAYGFVVWNPPGEARWRRQLLFTLALVTLFWGAVLVSFPRWALLPQGYLAAADTRSIEPRGINTATWTQDFLGPDHHFAADRINGLLLISFGHQTQITGSFYGINIPGVFLDPTVTEVEYQTLCAGEVRFILVDYRLTEYLPMLGYYYEIGELKEGVYTAPLLPGVFTKFDVAEHFTRIYDNGKQMIYHVDLTACER